MHNFSDFSVVLIFLIHFIEKIFTSVIVSDQGLTDTSYKEMFLAPVPHDLVLSEHRSFSQSGDQSEASIQVT